jgi:uncharacterized protein YggE
MKTVWFVLLIILCGAVEVSAQEAGNVAYGNKTHKSSGVALGNLYSLEPKDSVVSTFLEANTLMNARADEYVAVFGLSQEGPTPAECNRKIDAQVKEFTADLEGLGINRNDLFVDFIAQNRIYDFSGTSTAREKLAGFEVKKNVAVHYKDKTVLEKMLAGAAKASIFDLIKVDYIVNDLNGIRERLLEEAMKVVKRKEAEYSKLLDAKLKPLAIYQEKYSTFSPSQMYSSYTAYESGNTESVRVVEKRKSRTFYFDPLDSGEFDSVINPVTVEPVVQFTLYLKIKYQVSKDAN